MEKIKNIVENQRFINFIIVLIVINGITMGLETSKEVMADFGTWIDLFDTFVITVFTIEILMKISVYKGAFFKDPWNLFDFTIVAISLVPATSGFEIFRVLRVLRLFRLVTVIPQMRKIVLALASVIPGMTSIAALLTLLFYIFAIMATQLFGEAFPEWFGTLGAIMGILAALSARNFAMGFNRYLDRDIDALNPRTIGRPSVDGRLSPNQIYIFTILNAIIFILVAYFVNDLAFYLSVPILLVIGSYSYFKRFSALAHIILGISLGLAPIAGVVAVSETITLWSIYLSLGVMFWVAGFDLLYSLQDIEVDKELGLHSIPSRFGVEKTMLFSKIMHILTIIFWALFVQEANLGMFGFGAIVASIVMLSYEHYLVNKDFQKIDKAFFTVNGYLGILFFIFIILDVAI